MMRAQKVLLVAVALAAVSCAGGNEGVVPLGPAEGVQDEASVDDDGEVDESSGDSEASPDDVATGGVAADVPEGAVAVWDEWVGAFDDAIRRRAFEPQNDFSATLFEDAGRLAGGSTLDALVPAEGAITDADVTDGRVTLDVCMVTSLPSEFQTGAGMRYAATATVVESDGEWEVTRVDGLDRFHGDDDATLRRCITNEARDVAEPFVMDAFQTFTDAMEDEDSSVLEQSSAFGSVEGHSWMALVLDVMVDPNSREEVQEAGVGTVHTVADTTLTLHALNQTRVDEFDGVMCIEGPFGVRDADGEALLGADGYVAVQFRGIDGESGPELLSSAPTTDIDCAN